MSPQHAYSFVHRNSPYDNVYLPSLSLNLHSPPQGLSNQSAIQFHHINECEIYTFFLHNFISLSCCKDLIYTTSLSKETTMFLLYFHTVSFQHMIYQKTDMNLPTTDYNRLKLLFSSHYCWSTFLLYKCTKYSSQAHPHYLTLLRRKMFLARYIKYMVK